MNDLLMPLIALIIPVMLLIVFKIVPYVRDYLNERRIKREWEEARRREEEQKATERSAALQEQIRQTTASHTINARKVSNAITAPCDEQLALLHAIERGGNFFIQGQAGTGKSTLVASLRRGRRRHVRVACVTGLAALNVEGVTLHSLFKFPLQDVFDVGKLRLQGGPRRMLEETELLIIDEVSMVRPDMLDAIDRFAKMARHDDAPFGGIQVILMGDMLQLPPVIIEAAKPELERLYGYELPYFFDAPSYKNGGFTNVQLHTVYRQTDTLLLQYLNNIRKMQSLDDSLEFFNSLKIKDREILDTAVTLTAKRDQAEIINTERLEKLYGDEWTYPAKVQGSFGRYLKNTDTEKKAPAPPLLRLKVGALAMVLRNFSAECVNGSSVVVTDLRKDSIGVRLLDSGKQMYIERCEWTEQGYDSEHNLVTTGSYVQFPLQLGYALTVHKAQGKTLNKANICLSGAFAHGHAYVALSRVRRAEDLHMGEELEPEHVVQDARVVKFLEACERGQDLRAELREGIAQVG